jgi:hypothetical protein
MTTRQVLRGAGWGLVIWFFSALYFGILVDALLPTWADDLRTMASAGFLPMAVISALVMIRQGHGLALARFSLAMAGGGVLWFILAAGVGTLLLRAIPDQVTPALLRAVNGILLAASFGAAWWVSGRLNPDAWGGPPPPARS